MCHLLGVTRSGYYAWQPEKAGPRELENRVLVEQIRVEYKTSRQTYGSPRIWASRAGMACGRHRVARLMRRKHHPPNDTNVSVTTQRQPGASRHPTVWTKTFLHGANTKWVSDFTYIDTAEGWLYLAIILDLFSRKVLGWAMSEHMNTALVETALHMALQTRQPDATLLHHSDQGSQYTSAIYQNLSTGHSTEHEQGWQLLRQRCCRKFLWHPES
jgi:transposase InsO family protein